MQNGSIVSFKNKQGEVITGQLGEGSMFTGLFEVSVQNEDGSFTSVEKYKAQLTLIEE